MSPHDTAAPVAAQTQAPPPEALLTQMAFGALLTQALYVAAKLGIADLLTEGPKPVAELAAATGTHEGALRRVLRSLAGVGVFRQAEAGVFALTPMGEALRSDAPGSIRNGAIFMGEEWHWKVWGRMMHSVKTGEAAWADAHGAEVFDYFATRTDEAEIFNRAMTDMSQVTAPAVVEAYDFEGVGTLADIAGGHGYLLAQVLKANPGMKGVLFDVPPVIAGADALLEAEGVAGRVEKVAGDFFEAIPAGADAYMMKHIVHDWDDERCRKILRSIHRAMSDGG